MELRRRRLQVSSNRLQFQSIENYKNFKFNHIYRLFVGVVGMGGGPPPSKPIDFRANRPFLYLIREKIANSILFIGSFEKPE